MADRQVLGAGATGRRERSQYESEFGRIVAFSDGVFAIAITLLVLNLEVPPSGDDSAALASDLLELWPHLLAYVISFAVIGRFWLVHHRFFTTLGGFDGTLMVLNLAYLALIVLVPFSSDLLGEFGELAPAVMVYAGIIGLAALVDWTMIRHALRADLVRQEHRLSTEPFGSARALLIAGIFLASVPVALLSPVVAQVMWAGSMLTVRQQRRIGARLADRHPQ